MRPRIAGVGRDYGAESKPPLSSQSAAEQESRASAQRLAGDNPPGSAFPSLEQDAIAGVPRHDLSPQADAVTRDRIRIGRGQRHSCTHRGGVGARRDRNRARRRRTLARLLRGRKRLFTATHGGYEGYRHENEPTAHAQHPPTPVCAHPSGPDPPKEEDPGPLDYSPSAATVVSSACAAGVAPGSSPRWARSPRCQL